ncbi:MAG: hypothetical protein ACLR8Y_17255 [Alistipes indistinctus]
MTWSRSKVKIPSQHDFFSERQFLHQRLQQYGAQNMNDYLSSQTNSVFPIHWWSKVSLSTNLQHS